ncbi:unnamed protein product [Choristocarpus tenellus]
MGLENLPIYRQEGYVQPEINFLPVFVVFTLSVFALETLLDIRQHHKLKQKTPPSALLHVVKKVDHGTSNDKQSGDGVQAKFTAAQTYGLDKSQFHFVESIFDLTLTLVINALGFMPWLWDISIVCLSKVGVEGAGDIPISLVFMLLGIFFQTLVGLPFSMYSTFVIEVKHGFNKQTIGLFLADKVGYKGEEMDNFGLFNYVKGLLLSFVIGAPAVAAVLYIIDLGGQYFYMYIWGFLVFLVLVMMTVYPIWIMPLFNKYTLLEDGELKTAIEALAAKVSFPLTKLYVVDGSKRSGHSNAYFYGFFKNKRIVLFDTLIQQASVDEIVAILGHELGHWKKSHTLQGFAISQSYVFVSFCAFALASELGESLRMSFGYSAPATLITLYLFFAVMWAPVDNVLSVLMNMLSRKNEFQADAYAVEHGYSKDLVTGLVKLQLENLENMVRDLDRQGGSLSRVVPPKCLPLEHQEYAEWFTV